MRSDRSHARQGGADDLDFLAVVRTRDWICGAVASLTRECGRLHILGGTDHVRHLRAHRVGPPCPVGNRRSSRSIWSSSPPTWRNERHTAGSSATGACRASACVTAASASSIDRHMRRRARGAVACRSSPDGARTPERCRQAATVDAPARTPRVTA